ncbi:MAG: hypothetical protein ACI9E4_001053 [Pseudohongiellaceae bacterium]|jgi:hypothetical protein
MAVGDASFAIEALLEDNSIISDEIVFGRIQA